MGKTVTVPHFNGGTVEFASRERDKSNQGIKTLCPFLKNITEDNDLENFQGLIVALDACYWLHKAISISLSRFGEDRRYDLADLSGDFLLLIRFYVLFGLYVNFYVRVKEICGTHLHLLN